MAYALRYFICLVMFFIARGAESKVFIENMRENQGSCVVIKNKSVWIERVDAGKCVILFASAEHNVNTIRDLVFLFIKISTSEKISQKETYYKNNISTIFSGDVPVSGVYPDGTVWGQLKFNNKLLSNAIIMYTYKKSSQSLSLYISNDRSVYLSDIEGIMGIGWVKLSNETVGERLGLQSAESSLSYIRYTAGNSVLTMGFSEIGTLAYIRAEMGE